MRPAGSTKLSDAQVAEIRRLLRAHYPIRHLSLMFKISESTVRNIKHRRGAYKRDAQLPEDQRLNVREILEKIGQWRKRLL